MTRKRLLFLLALLMTAATGAWAQQTLTVYDGTFIDNTSPANILFCDEYTRCQTVIPSTALTDMKGCDITAMKFYTASAATGTLDCSFNFYLKEVSYSAFTDPYAFESQSSCTTVYQGKPTIEDGTHTLTVTFSKPFHYNGGNLLIGAENPSKHSYYYDVRFYGISPGTTISNISINHKTDLASASIKSKKFIPKTTFTYVDPTYSVKLADGTQDAKNWTITSGEKSATGDAADGLTGLSKKDPVTLTYGGRLKVKSVTATTDAEPVTLATPLTIEAITPGTIMVFMNDELETGMKYSVNGGAKIFITTTTSIEDLKAGDKVQFYGNGTQTQAYGDVPEVSILGDGDGFKTKVYGNIMSLLDETGFATKTDLPNAEYVFYGLFKKNATLIDASELLLPAATLQKSCYQAMFADCTSLTKAPKLPATTLTEWCYLLMFKGCSKLATVTCLATSGINQDNSTSNWLQGAGSEVQGTKTFNAVSTAEWPVDNINGIPTGWTRVNIDN